MRKKSLLIYAALLVLFLLVLTGCSETPPDTPPAGVETPAVPTVNEAPQETVDSPTAEPSPTTLLPEPTPGVENTPEPAPTTAEPPAVQNAAQMPDPQAFQWQLVTEGLQAPIGIASAGDGSGRLFILEQAGVIRMIQQDQLLPEPFLDIRDRVGSRGSEQGLLGLAFHPNYEENGFFYVNYTDRDGSTVIARFSVDPGDPNRADPDSESRLLQVQQPFANHNGGALAFGPDGFLYLGLGDGGSGGDPLGNGQSLQTLLGKILRIDVDGAEPYSIPADNPFAGGGGLPEIWAYGLRNPWRFSFDRLSGDLYIADVGQNSFEEIDFQPAGSPGGQNYGWNIMEAFECFRPANCDQSGLVLPVASYPTHEAGNCSVTGGVVYRGSLPEWQGIYLFGDYCSGRVWGLLRGEQDAWEQTLLYENVARITSFGEDEQGEVYLTGHEGTIYRLSPR